ncbi:MAG: hypothetical protein DMG09_03830 [Acidobacteria bacterium]|nr:MAG: hypothetical protein DMG09_03830 [Acidobacteriota bacterium]
MLFAKDFCAFSCERTHPVHHEDTKTRRIAKDFFAFSCLRGEISLVAALLIRVHRCSSVVSFCAIYANENSFRSAKGFSG